MLDFQGIAKPTIEDMQRLGRCLNLCKRLKELILINSGIDAKACEALFSTLTNAAQIQEIKWGLRTQRLRRAYGVCLGLPDKAAVLAAVSSQHIASVRMAR